MGAAYDHWRGKPVSNGLPKLDERLALTLPEAAQALGVSERHLRSMLPEIPHLHMGKRVVIPVDALRDWLRSEANAEVSRAGKLAEEIVSGLGDI